MHTVHVLLLPTYRLPVIHALRLARVTVLHLVVGEFGVEYVQV